MHFTVFVHKRFDCTVGVITVKSLIFMRHMIFRAFTLDLKIRLVTEAVIVEVVVECSLCFRINAVIFIILKFAFLRFSTTTASATWPCASI